MPENPYRIIIEYANNGVDGNLTPNGMRNDVNTNVAAFTPKSYVLLEEAQQVGKTLFNYGINTIEMYTGNGLLQAQAKTGVGLIKNAALIAINPAIGLTALALNIGTRAATRNWEVMWKNRNSQEMLRRSGNYLTNGSRK